VIKITHVGILPQLFLQDSVGNIEATKQAHMGRGLLLWLIGIRLRRCPAIHPRKQLGSRGRPISVALPVGAPPSFSLLCRIDVPLRNVPFERQRVRYDGAYGGRLPRNAASGIAAVAFLHRGVCSARDTNSRRSEGGNRTR
jgi:hypothetical protein